MVKAKRFALSVIGITKTGMKAFLNFCIRGRTVGFCSRKLPARLKCFVVSLLLFHFCASPVIGQSITAKHASATEKTTFSPAAWNQELATLEKKIESTSWTTDKVNTALQALIALRKNAQECIKKTKEDLKDFEIAFAPLSSSTSTTGKPASTHIESTPQNKKKIALVNLETECHLFLLHSDDVYTELEIIQQKLITTRLLIRNADLLTNIRDLHFKELATKFNKDQFFKNLGFNYFTSFTTSIFGGCLFAALLLSLISRYYCAKLIQAKKADSRLFGCYKTLSRYSIPLVFTIVLVLFFTFFNTPYFSTALAKIAAAFLIYTILLGLVRIIFYPPTPARPLISLTNNLPFLLTKRLFYFFTLSLIFYIAFTLLKGQHFSSLLSLLMTLYIFVSSFFIMSIVISVTQAFKSRHPFLPFSLISIFAVIFFVIVISEWAGYSLFSLFLFKNFVITLTLLFLVWIIQIFLRNGIHLLENNMHFQRYLGVRILYRIPELYLIKLMLLIVIWSTLIALLLKTWSLTIYFENFIDILKNGFSIAGLSIFPSRWFLAIVIFVILSLFIRILQIHISKKNKSYVEQGAQVTVASILGYVGFFISLIIALVVAGINFTSLAIIAGALSVGIGFGLQNIINNFISGLILLIESPIHPGDRIIVGDTEGFVKRIRLRATQIVTLQGADVFIPNAELVSKNVVNMMFRDPRWRVVCDIGVAYGSNIELVKEKLLEVAMQHPKVIKDEPNIPKVFLTGLGDSAVKFSLWCMIEHVNSKFIVESELYTKIIQVFEQHKITIPFPQQDIHVKDWPGNKPPPGPVSN